MLRCSLPCRYGCIRPRSHVCRTEIVVDSHAPQPRIPTGIGAPGMPSAEIRHRTFTSTPTARDSARRRQVPKRGYGRYRSAADVPMAASQALPRSLPVSHACVRRTRRWAHEWLAHAPAAYPGRGQSSWRRTLQVNAVRVWSGPSGATTANRSQGFPANADYIIYAASAFLQNHDNICYVK